MAKRGRPQRPFETSWGEMVPGLYKCPDGRWRLTATGQKFTEPDERRAVARFRSMQQPSTVDVPIGFQPHPPTDNSIRIEPPPAKIQNAANARRAGHLGLPRLQPFAVELGDAVVTAAEFWSWLREQVIARPEYIAKMIGIPELANLRHLPLPRPAITIDKLVEAYDQHNPSTQRTKRRVIATVRKLAEHAGAKTLDDLTQEKLSAWRQDIESDPKYTSAGTRVGLYGQVKATISFGLKVGMDQAQIRAALDRTSVLWTAEALPPVQPQPISREDFHRLLGAADTTWRAWLLLALNLAMTAEDLCELRWKDFDLDAGTYAAIRVKTSRDRIPRAGVLWEETREAMQTLPGRSEFVFTSPHGTRYSKNSRVNLFAKLRAKAGIPSDVKMNHIRDAAYTTACRATTDERWARVLAGHRAAGLQDHYVLRNPEAVRPACEAVHATYGPFRGS